MSGYQAYAKIYDYVNVGRNYEEWVDQFMKLAQRAGFQGKRVLDLACGTGAATLIMAEKGMEVTGMDLSEFGVEDGRSKAKEKGLSVKFAVGDMTDFEVEERVPLITIFNGGINLLPEDKIGCLASCVREALEPNGILVLDILGKGLLFAPETTMVFLANPLGYYGSLIKRTGDEMNLHHHIFIKEGDYYQLSEEREHIYLHSPYKIRDIFADKGMKVIRNVTRGPLRSDLVAVRSN